jgi:tRNA threonylcarbamoyladenosine biosynthesis protein TsaB
MLVLSFDTTSEHGGAAIFRDGECLASARSDSAANYSVTLFQMVERLVHDVHALPGVPFRGLQDVELFAVANGPGSFTGIRVGLAAAQAWGKAFGRPVRGVSVLAAMVEQAGPEAELAVPILDARRGEFYLGSFRRTGAGDDRHFVPEDSGLVMKPAGLARYLEERAHLGRTITCSVREHDRAAQAMRGALPGGLGWTSVAGTLLAAIARLALRAHQDGENPPPAELDAYYIRRSDAELNWKE